MLPKGVSRAPILLTGTIKIDSEGHEGSYLPVKLKGHLFATQVGGTIGAIGPSG